MLHRRRNKSTPHRRPAKTARRKSAPAKPRRVHRGGWLRGLVLLGLWVLIGLALMVSWYAWDMPDPRQAVEAERRPSITLLSNDGKVFARFGEFHGENLAVADLPPHLVQAVLAVEDRRFYSHFGVDPLGLVRAVVRNLGRGHLSQGGSTITQQLAKNLFLSPDRTIRRKVQEVLIAVWLERNFTKDEILAAYLNKVYFGAGAFGVDAASQIYFGKSARHISLREAAVLAGLLKAPSRYAPTSNPNESALRTSLVLDSMQDAGFLSPEQRARLSLEPPPPRAKPGAAGDGLYFADWVIEQAAGLTGGDFGHDVIIQTTLDIKLQRAAERHLDSILASASADQVGQAALVALAPDGAVRCLVGGRDARTSPFNRATQAKRQPGSAFKPIVYLAGLESGLEPDSIMNDQPIRMRGWQPENYDGRWRGQMPLREALAQSINSIAVQVLQQAGITKVRDIAARLGITTPMGRDLSLALGTSEVTLMDLTTAYATFSQGGHAVLPYAIEEVRTPQGTVLYRRPDVSTPQIASEDRVSALVSMMRDVVTEGTGKRAALGSRPVAGKTGTSQDYRDAWFVGFTADMTMGVWMGNDDNKPMRKVVGGNWPAQLWHDVMAEASAGLPERDLLSGAVVAEEGQDPVSVGNGDQGSDMIGNLIDWIDKL
ncbi:MAG: PBP1A family penicillin-binding protein [Alphaproteobacteria bacterium]|nr:MAG: PBP1A family penicillin-binding protein [Alphaproteobacteria bacterium]